MSTVLMTQKEQLKIQNKLLRKKNEEARVRKSYRDRFQSINMDNFDKQNPQNDPYRFFDKSKQKIVINPGIAYISTSQADIFELRSKTKDQRKKARKLNRFIKPPNDKEKDE